MVNKEMFFLSSRKMSDSESDIDTGPSVKDEDVVEHDSCVRFIGLMETLQMYI